MAQFNFAVTYFAGVKFIEDGLVSFEDLFITMMVALMTSQSLGRASTFGASLDKGKLGAIKCFEFIERQTLIDPCKDGYIPKEFDPAFEFKNVAFTYPARPDQVRTQNFLLYIFVY